MTNVVKQSNHKMLMTIILGMMILFVVAVYFGIMHHQKPVFDPTNIKVEGTFLNEPVSLTHFNLTDNQGQSFTNEQLKGHWSILFFGFTNCGYVCPTAMAALNKMYIQMQSKLPPEQMPQIVMISVDPDRDSVERMNSYVKSFNTHFMGARADMQETLALEKQFNVVAAKIASNTDDKSYTIEHSSDLKIIDPQGQLRAYLHSETPEQMSENMLQIITQVPTNS